MFRPALPPVEPPAGWWNSRWFLLLLVLIATVPLILPITPPLTDLPEHMGRYRIQLSAPSSPLRSEYFSFHWAFIANLGFDLAIVPMSALFGLELGTKLLVIGLVLATAIGMLWIAAEVHGRVPPTALFALPLCYNYPFIWGFVNFLLSMALALNAYALWLRLGRQGRFALRHALFVPIGLILTTAHIFGWAVLCLLAYAAEVVRGRDAGLKLWPSLWRGGLSCLSLAPPLLLMVLWRTDDAGGANVDFFFLRAKYVYMISSLRSLTMNFDLNCVFLLCTLIALGLGSVWVRMNRTLGIAALMLMIAYALLPRILIGSAYADMRLAPYVIVIALIALAPKSPSRRQAAIVACAATALFVWRISLLTDDFARRDANNQHQLEALDHIPPNSRVFVQVALPCLNRWQTSRMDHLGAIAIVRRDAFANGQWTAPGAQLVRIQYRPARRYAEDPTEIMRPRECSSRRRMTYPTIINTLPHNAFDYAWIIDMPRDRWNSFPGLVPIWTGGDRGILYKVVPPASGSATRPIETPSGKSPRTAA
ncbi:hypothetical protein [Sphingomonas sp. MMS24-J13]|uniref:hypothetical protein n=1 Tax=Sphingomonas sp. MMS24-J13 TaxID=3238686 RepID=UPI00384C5C82